MGTNRYTVTEETLRRFDQPGPMCRRSLAT